MAKRKKKTAASEVGYVIFSGKTYLWDGKRYSDPATGIVPPSAIRQHLDRIRRKQKEPGDGE